MVNTENMGQISPSFSELWCVRCLFMAYGLKLFCEATEIFESLLSLIRPHLSKTKQKKVLSFKLSQAWDKNGTKELDRIISINSHLSVHHLDKFVMPRFNLFFWPAVLMNWT